MTLEGQKPELPSLLLNSHVDVVPVFEVRGKGQAKFLIAWYCVSQNVTCFSICTANGRSPGPIRPLPPSNKMAKSMPVDLRT